MIKVPAQRCTVDEKGSGGGRDHGKRPVLPDGFFLLMPYTLINEY